MKKKTGKLGSEVYLPQSSGPAAIAARVCSYARRHHLLFPKPRSQNKHWHVLRSPIGSYQGLGAPVLFDNAILVLGLVSPVGWKKVLTNH